MSIKNFLKKTIKYLFKRNGFEIYRKYYYDFNPDDSILKILNIASADISDISILDVGANVGQSVRRFRKYLRDAHIFSFEPNPKTFQVLLKKHANDKKLKCFNFGIGAEKRALPFFMNPDSGSDSFYQINLNGDAFRLSNTKEAKKNHNISSLKQRIPYNSTVQIPVDTLNNVCASEGLKRIDILKIDTQGFELQVLKGANNILSNTLIVEAEVIFSDSYEKTSSFGEIESLLRQYGFVVWEIPYIGKFPTENINRINFVDIQFVNTKLLCNYNTGVIVKHKN